MDVITIGQAGVDLYGAQIGGRLEDMGSFEKYIGGSPTITLGILRPRAHYNRNAKNQRTFD